MNAPICYALINVQGAMLSADPTGVEGAESMTPIHLATTACASANLWLRKSGPWRVVEVHELQKPPAVLHYDDFTGEDCSVCGEPQFMSPSGVTCKNGHGGADPK